MLAWNMTWLTPWATAPAKPTPTSGPPGSTRGTPMAWPRKNRAQVVTMNGVVYVGNGTYRRISQVTSAATTQPTARRAMLAAPGRKKNSVAIPTSAELKP